MHMRGVQCPNLVIGIRKRPNSSFTSRTLRSFSMLSRRLLPQLSNSLKTLGRSASSSTSSKVPATKPATTEPSVVTQQAPNFPTTWSTNQRQRPVAGEGPRFEQTHMELQPAPLSAMELVANEPVRFVDGRKAICDGGMCAASRLVALNFSSHFWSQHTWFQELFVQCTLDTMEMMCEGNLPTVIGLGTHILVTF